MDERFLEQAEELAAAEVRSGIERARKRTSPPPGFDGTCECGAAINPKRIELGYYRCVDCQANSERIGRQYRT